MAASTRTISFMIRTSMTADTTITDAALLQLLWIASPGLPIGGFSYSEGLEAAVEAGLVHSERDAGEWLVDQLHLSLARSELPVIAQALLAWRAGDQARVEQLNDWVLRTRETGEMRRQTEQMGHSLVEWLKTVRPELVLRQTQDERNSDQDERSAGASARSDLTYPVALALALSASPATPRQALLACAFGWAENMMQAAVKSVPLGQSDGQRILARLAAEVPLAVDTALGLYDDQRQAFAPMLAILSARHETQYSRLFRS
jgi:urease accessory protein